MAFAQDDFIEQATPIPLKVILQERTTLTLATGSKKFKTPAIEEPPLSTVIAPKPTAPFFPQRTHALLPVASHPLRHPPTPPQATNIRHPLPLRSPFPHTGPDFHHEELLTPGLPP